MSDDSKQTPRADGAAILRDMERSRKEARKGSIFVSLPGDERVYLCEDADAAATLIHGWSQRQPLSLIADPRLAPEATSETPPAAPGAGPSSE